MLRWFIWTEKHDSTKRHQNAVQQSLLLVVYWSNFPSQAWRVFVSFIQLECCGFNNHTDFVGSNFEEENGGNLPPSCCWSSIAPCRPADAERSAVQVRCPCGEQKHQGTPLKYAQWNLKVAQDRISVNQVCLINCQLSKLIKGPRSCVWAEHCFELNKMWLNSAIHVCKH